MKYYLIAIVSIIFLSCNFNSETYIEKIQKEREETDKEFKNPDKSPLKKEDIANFKGLEYFPVDTIYRVKAKIEKVKDADTILFKTTTERTPKYYTYAIAKFRLNNEDFEIKLYRNVEFMNHEEYGKLLFLPFSDYTSGNETYGGGRYIDIEIPEGDEVIIDFNKSYNPYCAYNSKYSCPIPPDDNFIKTEIKAGVKKFDKGH